MRTSAYADAKTITFDDGSTMDVVPYDFDAPAWTPREEDPAAYREALHQLVSLVWAEAQADDDLPPARRQEIVSTLEIADRQFDRLEREHGLARPVSHELLQMMARDVCNEWS